MYAIAGNHDDIEMMKSAFIDTSIKIDEYLSIDKFNFIFIDSSKKPKKEMMLGAGRVSDHDIQKIKNAKKETVIVIHQPIFENGTDWFNKIGLENQNEVAQSVLNNTNIKHIICGHGHSFIKTKVKGTTQTMSPSTSYGFDHHSKVLAKTNRIGAVMIDVGEDIESHEIKIPERTECSATFR
nr:metallophosphoesterase [Vibrio zhanjiangensis]